MTCSTCSVIFLSIYTNEYSEIWERIYGIHIGVGGFGAIVSPLVGSILYSLLGCQGMFFVFGTAVMVLAAFIRLSLHRYERVKKTDANEAHNQMPEESTID